MIQESLIREMANVLASGEFEQKLTQIVVLGIGDTVGKVRILKIDQEKVEFAKDGTTWAQQLGAAPQPFWD